jgi:hypothetical protein
LCRRDPGQDPEGVQRQRRHDGPPANSLHRQLHVFRAAFRLPRHGGHWIGGFSIYLNVIVLPGPVLLIPEVFSLLRIRITLMRIWILLFTLKRNRILPFTLMRIRNQFHSDADPDPI